MMRIVNTYHVPYPDLDGRGVAFLAVLTMDDRGKFAVYSGMVALPEADNDTYPVAWDIAAKTIMLSGLKERYNRAKTFYPDIREADYRA